jgi:hypothetical protein
MSGTNSRRCSCGVHFQIVAALVVAACAGEARAQAVAQGATTGYELALQGVVESELDSSLQLQGVAYEVDGLAALRATRGLQIEAEVTALEQEGQGRPHRRVTKSRSVATAGDGGRFVVSVPLPAVSLASPQLSLTVHRPGQPGRTFEYPLAAQPPLRLDLLTDRRRYEPGETVHAWVRATAVRGGAPAKGASIELALVDAAGRPAGNKRLTSSAAGVAAFDLALPESAPDGQWTVRAAMVGGGIAQPAERAIEVSRRTVERLQASLAIDQELVWPGGTLSGRVVVRTPSGAPVRRARVELERGTGEPLILETDAEGIARFSTQAPAFLSGDVATQTLEARVVHAAHGTIRASATYTVTRVAWMVEATPEAGGLVPEVESELFLTVADPRGRPVAAGTRVTVRGVGVRGGTAEATTDARGLAVVPMALPRGAASRRQSGPCQGSVATSVEVDVLAREPVTARLCVPVAADALVLPRADRSLLAPGDDVVVTVLRRPEVRDRPVVVEALWSGRAVAWGWAQPGQTRATLSIPDHLLGVVELRARPVWPSDRTRPLDQPGATAFGVGASTAVLVRPADAFSLTVTPERELYRVRDQARVSLRASRPPDQGWAALLVRDEAAHGGEGAWDLGWIRRELEEAVSAGDTPDGDRFLRLSLAALVSPDMAQAEPPPLVGPAWAASRSTGAYAPRQAQSTGVLRDPVAQREELLRRGLAPAMMALERAVARLGSNERAGQGIARRSGARVTFDPRAVATVVAARELSEDFARTLGGEALTVAMIAEADPSFTFDAAARRVTRERLLRLLHGLLELADPDNPAAARASAGEPPERWLSRLVQLGMIQPDALVDPWGRPFAFRPTSGRDPAVVVSEQALDLELVSAGPDGAFGTGDDVRDPLLRVVPRGTPYAVASGEDALMERLARLAPGGRVLSAMAQAYRRLGLAASEEQRRGPVEATGSEDLAPAGATSSLDALLDSAQTMDEEEADDGRFEARDRAAEATRRPARDMQSTAEYDNSLGPPAESPAPMQVAEPSAAPTPATVAPAGFAQTLGAMVRERFPATLFFRAETPFGTAGVAEVELPLADALTTYRLEAIAWSASGWTTSSAGRLRVDQEAMVDAPIPPFATVGDRLRIPVRVANRTDAPMPVQIEVEAEGDLALDLPPVPRIEVPPGEAVEAVVEIRAANLGSGTLLVRAHRTDSGRALDAVRRPLEILEDTRLAREVREELIEAGQALRIEVPEAARPRGPGELRLAVGGALFGDPAEWGPPRGQGGLLWAGWALAATGREVPEALRAPVLATIDPDRGGGWYQAPQEAALVLALLWTDTRLADDVAREGLRLISSDLPGPDAGDAAEGSFDTADLAWRLLALAPALAAASHRPALREDLERIEDQFRRLVSSAAAQASDAPEVWALAAATLALGDRTPQNARALEMIRRAERHVITVGDEAWLEPPTTDGSVLPRVEPTALLALARLALGQDRPGALALLRSLSRVVRGADRWPDRTRALASAAAALLAPASASRGPVTVRLDGRALEVRHDEGVDIAVLDDVGRPGTHRIEVDLAQGDVALAWLDLRYGLPWTVRPDREAPVELEWTGAVGARDGRAGLRLEVRNRGARILTRPVVEVELPAGTELDEPTREALAALLAGPVSSEGRTLRLSLRPLAPGGYLRLPLPLRWALGGTVIGLGTSMWDDAGPTSLAARQVRVVPSRGLEIADRGAEPEAPEAESSPPPPPPPCLPPIEPLALTEEVPR